MDDRLKSCSWPSVTSQHAAIERLAKNLSAAYDTVTPEPARLDQQRNGSAANEKILGATQITALYASAQSTTIGAKPGRASCTQHYLELLSGAVHRHNHETLGCEVRALKLPCMAAPLDGTTTAYHVSSKSESEPILSGNYGLSRVTSQRQSTGLCHLLGFRFAPRMRDPADRRLGAITASSTYKGIESLFGQTIKVGAIEAEWDDHGLHGSLDPRRDSRAISHTAQTFRLPPTEQA